MKVHTSLMEALRELNKWSKICDVSISVWWYSEIEEKKDEFGHFIRMGARYSSAIIDKLFFDIDCVDKDGKYLDKNYKGAIQLWRWAKKNGYKREIAFTSGGYQMVIGCKINCLNYSDTVKYVAQITGAIIDPDISPRMMRRLPGSYNFGRDGKTERHSFCISLKEEEVELPFTSHLKLSLNQRIDRYVYGNEYYLPPKFEIKREERILDKRTDFCMDTDIDIILESYGYTYDDICLFIRRIIEQPRVSHVERFMIIKYLKDVVGIRYGDLLVLLPKILTAPHGTGNDGTHSLIEGQPKSVYSSNYHFSPAKMIEDGYCEAGCTECSKFFEAVKKL
jgi:hypothetical protein